MKHCNRSSQCPYGNAFEKDLCAYHENMHEYDLCPYLLKNWDYIINKVIEKRGDDNNVE